MSHLILLGKSVKWQEFTHAFRSLPLNSHTNSKTFTEKLASFLFEATFNQSDISLISLQRILNYQVTRDFRC